MPFGLRRPRIWSSEKESAPAPDEDGKEERKEPVARTNYPTPEYEAHIKDIMDRLSEDVSRFSYRTADGDSDIGDRLETIIMDCSFDLAGALAQNSPHIARRLIRRIRMIADRYDGRELLAFSRFAMSEAIGASMWGRRMPGTSIDEGTGIDELLARRPLEP